MKRYQACLFDLDGTIYHGNKVIEGARRLLHFLRQNGVPYLFLTNNSTKPADVVARKLREMGVVAHSQDVITSATATARYLAERTDCQKVYVIGEEGLTKALAAYGMTFDSIEPDAVVVGLDRQVNYEKLARACLAIRNGARFIATNPDRALPTEKGLLPGNGAIARAIAASTNIAPSFIGKPEPTMAEFALEQLRATPEETILIGDNYDTDICCGMRAGIDTLLVFSGVTTKTDLRKLKKMPTYCVESLDEPFVRRLFSD